MHPTLFTIGNLSVPTYTVLLDLGLILGLVLTYFEGRRSLGSGELALDMGLWTVIGGVIGGRIGYVVANWRVFSEDWLRALRIWEGGLSFHGALLGGLLVMVIFAALQRRREPSVPVWELADVLTPGLSLGIAFGWLACLMGGCAYGLLGEGWGYAVLPDIYGVVASRFATQVVGLIFALVLFALVMLMRNRWPFAGAAFLMYGLIYFGGQFFLEFTRGDEAIYLGPWRLAQALDFVLALVAGGSLVVLWWKFTQQPIQPEAGRPEPAAAGEQGNEPVEPDEAEEHAEAIAVGEAERGTAEEEPLQSDEPSGSDTNPETQEIELADPS